jgi:hypothetical protein
MIHHVNNTTAVNSKIVINMIVYLYLNTPRGSCQIIINGFIKI